MDCCALSCAKHSLNIFCNSFAAHMRDKRRTYRSQQQLSRSMRMGVGRGWRGGAVCSGCGSGRGSEYSARIRSQAEVWALQCNFLHLNIFQKLFTVDFSPDAFHAAACACVCISVCVCECVQVLKIFVCLAACEAAACDPACPNVRLATAEWFAPCHSS